MSIADRGRLDELTDFYRHLNVVVDSMIEKFSFQEKLLNKIIRSPN